ncbi:MAG: hypothetical protein F9K44_09455 [Hyphomicrobiaceae bacterium]|nr:MAG: hypothetical protein F9K44_09455 [Hyphomicrobiaceae bacterium]
MPYARAGVSLVAGLLVGMCLRRPWQTARLVVCGLAILTVSVVLAVFFESGELAGVDLPLDAASGNGKDEEDAGKRRINDAIARRQRRLAELNP